MSPACDLAYLIPTSITSNVQLPLVRGSYRQALIKRHHRCIALIKRHHRCIGADLFGLMSYMVSTNKVRI